MLAPLIKPGGMSLMAPFGIVTGGHLALAAARSCGHIKVLHLCQVGFKIKFINIKFGLN